MKKYFVSDIEKLTLVNDNFREVLSTTAHSQLVLMCLNAGEDIGKETHPVDQFFRCERGTGVATLGTEEFLVHAGVALHIPAGTVHNISAGPDGEMKLYTIYAPPHHPVGTVHRTKADAIKDEGL
jgi:mannose-6-phosphate isomerase-like protein (cupin superfamily)